MKKSKRFISLLLSLLMITSSLAGINLTAYAETDNYNGACGNYLYYSFDDATKTLTIGGSGNMNENYIFNTTPWYSFKNEIQSLVVKQNVTTIEKDAFYGCINLTNVSLPDSLTKIGNYAFYSCSNMQSIVIPNNVTYIGSRAFSECSNLSEIKLSNKLESVFDYTFYNCSKLKRITVPDSVTYMGTNIFKNCNSLQEITLPFVGTTPTNDHQESYFGHIFGSSTSQIDGTTECSNKYYFIPQSLQKVTITQDVAIADLAFYNCQYLTEINYLKNTQTKIGNSTFYNCKSLKSFDIPNTVTSIGNRAFYNCVSLKSMEFPKTVIYINNSFYGCDNITDTYFNSYPDYLNIKTISKDDPIDKSTKHYDTNTSTGKIGDNINFEFNYDTKILTISGTGDMYNYNDSTSTPFSGYIDKVTDVEIGEGVTSVGDYIFSKGSHITNIKLPTTINLIGKYAFSECYDLEFINIYDGVTTIKERAFNSCIDLQSINWPNSLTTIEKYAFYNCESLQSIDLPNSVTEIENNAFQQCYALTSFTFPNQIQTINERVLYDCNNIVKVTIPFSVTTIKEGAFGCNKLTDTYYIGSFVDYSNIDIDTSLNLKLINSKKHFSINTYSGYCGENAQFNYNTTTKILTIYGTGEINDYDAQTLSPWYYYSDEITKIYVKNGITKIGNNCFVDCTKLTDVSLPQTVSTIGLRAFYRCLNLVNINIPNSVTNIQSSTFYNCSKLVNITLPKDLTDISPYAFYNCGIKSITIPTKVITINDCAFYNCPITNVYYDGSIGDFYNIVFGESNGITDKSPNLHCTSYVYTQKFGDNLSFTINYNTGEMSIDGTGAMPNYKYYDAYDDTLAPWDIFKQYIETVKIGEGVTTVGDFAFFGCGNMNQIILPKTITSIGGYAFKSCYKLKEINLPVSVNTIGGSCFEGSGLKDVFYNGNIGRFLSVDINSINYKFYDANFYYADPIYTGKCGENLDFTVNTDTNTLTISGTGDMDEYDDISSTPWAKCPVTKLVINEGITSISDFAFDGMLLTNGDITIPSTVTRIGENAFRDCSNLVYYIPNSVTELGDEIFGNLDTVVVCEKDSDIYNYCQSYENIIVVDSLTKTSQIQPAIINSEYSNDGYIQYFYSGPDDLDFSVADRIYAAKYFEKSQTKFVADGTVKIPTITVKDSRHVVIDSSNYDITYPIDPISAGNYEIIITFKGDYYSGTCKVRYSIVDPINFDAYDAAIQQANNVKASSDYQQKYTIQSRQYLELMIKDNTIDKTSTDLSQYDVDYATKAIIEATENLKLEPSQQKYSVNFVVQIDGEEYSDNLFENIDYGTLESYSVGSLIDANSIQKWTIETQNGATSQIQSTDDSIDYVVTDNVTLTCYMTAKPSSQTESSMTKVTLLNRTGSVITVAYVSNDLIIKLNKSYINSVGKAPTISFYNFSSWKVVAGNPSALNGDDIVLKAQYEFVAGDKDENCANIYGLDGVKINGQDQYKASYDQYLHLTGGSSDTKYAITDYCGNIISYLSTDYLHAPRKDNVYISLVSIDDVKTSACITGSFVEYQETDGISITFNCQMFVPEDATLVECGTIFTKYANIGTNSDLFKKDVQNVTQTKSSTQSSAGEYSVTYSGKSNNLTTVYGRSYVVYKDANGKNHTVYSDVTTINLDVD